MIIKVSELEEQGLAISDPKALEPAFSDPAWRLESLQLQISPDGSDVVIDGRLTATVPQTCGRCLESFRARADVRVDVRLLPRPATGDNMELGADDLDIDFYTDDQVDLNRVVETETTLALPMKPLCRDDCRGLCPVCGANRNLDPCACSERAPDPRLAPLRDLATRLRH